MAASVKRNSGWRKQAASECQRIEEIMAAASAVESESAEERKSKEMALSDINGDGEAKIIINEKRISSNVMIMAWR
jgi:hypothetical protein